MRKLMLAIGLLLAALALFSSINLGITFANAPPKLDEASVSSVDPTLQEWFIQKGYAINVTTDETGIETFEAGYYRMSILAEYADYAPRNNLSWYPANNGQLHYLFLGENVTGDSLYFMASETFGLCLGSPDGNFYTQQNRNLDGKDHALIFANPKGEGYIIAWEDLWNLGDADFQDMILAAFTPVNVDVHYCPRTLNLKSHGKWFYALIKLPEGRNASEIDVTSIMLNGTVAANRTFYATDEDCEANLLVVRFSRAAVIELVQKAFSESCGGKRVSVTLTITGNFKDGIPFQGTGKIRAIHFKS